MKSESPEVMGDYTEEEKAAILEKAPYIMGIVGPRTAKKLLKIAEEDTDYPFHNPPMVVGYEVTHVCNLRCSHCHNASGARGPYELKTGKAVYHLVGEVCNAGLWHRAVDPDGNFTPCAETSIFLGNVRETTLEEVWKHHETFRALRKRYQEIQGKCSTCEYLERCGGGCRGGALRVYGDILASGPGCIPPPDQKGVNFNV